MRASSQIEREYTALRRTLRHPERSRRLQRLLQEFREALRREGTPEQIIEIDVARSNNTKNNRACIIAHCATSNYACGAFFVI